MVQSKKFEIVRNDDEIILKFHYENNYNIPSIEDNPYCMAEVIEKLAEAEVVSKIVFTQRRDYEYDYAQTEILFDVAKAYQAIIKNKDLYEIRNNRNLTIKNVKLLNELYNEIKHLVFHHLKRDPIGTYVKLQRLKRRELIQLERIDDEDLKQILIKYLKSIDFTLTTLEKTKLIIISRPYLAGYKFGDREIYQKIFTPIIKPDFMFTKLMSNYPKNGIEIDSYKIGNTEVTIFELPESVQYIYHVMPPEFRLEEEEYELLDMARNIMAEHKPEESDFVNPKRMRDVFKHVGKDLILEISNHKGLNFSEEKADELAEILVRYTVGFGLIEIILSDEFIQDISVNSPLGHVPAFIVHAKYGDCVTNIIPSRPEAESWATKLRMISGRPLDEANQILDTELELPSASIRVSAITEPLAPNGLGFSFRRHRDKPWTLPLFIKNKMISPLGAGLISFLVDGTRSFLICGTRGSGKSSFLTSVMVEIMRRYRIITIEDTLELPTPSLRKLGFNIQPMKVSSALLKSGNEMNASDGIRSTLRLGDSALIVGEVRSTEAKALYEAMRVGAAANVVAGTIHGDSPYGIFDRVVNDIGVPKTSFKATDICIIANPVKSADGIHKKRRITQITEVRKNWDGDPLKEKAFVDLMKYNAKTDTVEPTDELINGESDILKMIAGNIPDFIGNWDKLWENIELRGRIKEAIVLKAEEIDNEEILEADFVIKCNDMFHKISSVVKKKTGVLDHKEIEFKWTEWFNKEIKFIQENKDYLKRLQKEDEISTIYDNGNVDLSDLNDKDLNQRLKHIFES